MTFRHVVLAIGAIALCAAFSADAARLGGGRSFGAQRPTLTAPRVAAPSAPAAANGFSGPAANPVMPRTPAAVGAAPAAATAAAAAPRPAGSRWLAPLAGIAAGIGLAALMSHFGMSSAFSGVLLVLLVIVAGALLARMFLTRRLALPGGTPMPAANDAAAAFEPRFGGAVQPPATPQAATNPPHWPAGFDGERFARQALQQFRVVQRAYDNGDTAALADVMTPELYTETVGELRSRGLHVATAFDTLAAEVLDVATEADLYWVSVRFHGLSREDGAAAAQSFDEVWNLCKPVDGSSGWLVAGIQQSVDA